MFIRAFLCALAERRRRFRVVEFCSAFKRMLTVCPTGLTDDDWLRDYDPVFHAYRATADILRTGENHFLLCHTGREIGFVISRENARRELNTLAINRVQRAQVRKLAAEVHETL